MFVKQLTPVLGITNTTRTYIFVGFILFLFIVAALAVLVGRYRIVRNQARELNKDTGVSLGAAKGGDESHSEQWFSQTVSDPRDEEDEKAKQNWKEMLLGPGFVHDVPNSAEPTPLVFSVPQTEYSQPESPAYVGSDSYSAVESYVEPEPEPEPESEPEVFEPEPEFVSFVEPEPEFQPDFISYEEPVTSEPEYKPINFGQPTISPVSFENSETESAFGVTDDSWARDMESGWNGVDPDQVSSWAEDYQPQNEPDENMQPSFNTNQKSTFMVDDFFSEDEEDEK